MLKWPTRAQRAVASFFVKWNDVDVFVEDTAKYATNVYSGFIGRILDGRAKVSTIFPLGDKQAVISACQADHTSGGKSRIYLVDGDLDLIAAIPAIKSPRLFTHEVYHLENYFICEEALLEVLGEENPRLTGAEVQEKLDFAGWISEIQPLLNLFRVFGVSRILDPSLPTIKKGIGSFSSNNRIDEVKIRAFCEDRMNHFERNFSAAAIEEAKTAVDKVVANKDRQQDLISAREYLLPCLRWWIAAKGMQLSAGKESLLYRLSRKCSLEHHENLVAAICATARA